MEAMEGMEANLLFLSKKLKIKLITIKIKHSMKSPSIPSTASIHSKWGCGVSSRQYLF